VRRTPCSSKINTLSVVIHFVLVLVVVALGLGVAEARKKRKAPPPPEDLPVHVKFLAQKLYGVMLEDSGEITGQIEKLVLDHLQQWMANRTPGDVEVRRELEKAFALLHYPLFGQPVVFAAPWKGAALIGAGYTLGWTDYDRVNVVALFESREGKSRLVAVTHFVPRTDLHYQLLEPRGWDDFRFLIYGFRLGKSQPRLSAILYALDGDTLKSLWETHDVYDGKLEVDNDKLIIRYLKEEEYIRELVHNRKPPRHEATYTLTPAGLQILSDREIPF
jgi:hypothetical protein